MTALDRSAAAHARATAGKIRQAMKDYWAAVALVSLAYEQRHWETLGYESWESYCEGEFGPERLGLPAEHRARALDVFRLTGMSVRAIASATGVPKSSVGDAITELSDAGQLATRERVTGVDGISRPATQTPARRDSDPNDSPGPAVGPAGEPDLPEGVAPTVGGREDGAASSFATPAGPDAATAVTHPDRPGLEEFVNDDAAVQAASYMAAFAAAMSRSGSFLGFDAERVAGLASGTTWATVVAHRDVFEHWFEKASRARKGLRIIKGGAA